MATYALMTGAAASLLLGHSHAHALPLASLWPAVVIYALVTFRLTFAEAGRLRVFCTGFFLVFSDSLLTALLTQQPLHPQFQLLVGEYILLFLLLSAIPRTQVLAATKSEISRAVLFLLTGFVKSNSLGRTLHSVLAADLSLRTVSFAVVLGVLKLMSGAVTYFVDMLVTSRTLPALSGLQRYAKVGAVMTVMVVCAVACSVWAEVQTSTWAILTANLACVAFFGTEARAYGVRLKES